MIFRIRFILLHPVRSFTHLVSGKSDYSKIQINDLSPWLDNPRVIIEAGAADGVDTLTFSECFPEAKIFAAEPVKMQFDYLLAITKSRDNIYISNIALSNRDEEAEIYVGKGAGNMGGMGSSSLLKPLRHEAHFPDIKFEERQRVKSLKLSSYMNSVGIESVDLLWLDVQGKELDILMASREILRHSIRLVHLEISKVKLYEGMASEREIRRFLSDSGFICVIDKVGAISGNAVFLNNNPNVLVNKLPS
jgi:FkbM family methyltransferase